MGTFYWPFVRGITPVTGEFPAQRPVTRSFDVFFDLHLNEQLSKQWRRRWFETLMLTNQDPGQWTKYVSLNTEQISKCEGFHIYVIYVRANLIFIGAFNILKRSQMVYIVQTTFWKIFYWIKMSAFVFGFNWSLLLVVQLTIRHHWFR